MARTLVLLACIAALVTAAWLQLVDSSFRRRRGRPQIAGARAGAPDPRPALVTRRPPARRSALALLVLGLLPAAGYALGRPGHRHAPGRAATSSGPSSTPSSDGFSDFYETHVPFDPGRPSEMCGTRAPRDLPRGRDRRPAPRERTAARGRRRAPGRRRLARDARRDDSRTARALRPVPCSSPRCIVLLLL